MQEELRLNLSEDKTLITHARTEAARFLGYHLSVSHDDTYQTHHVRHINGQIRLRIPPDVLTTNCQRYQRNGKPLHRPELTNNTVYSIVAQYQAEYRGLVEYYRRANDLHRFNRLQWIMDGSLCKTLAAKLKLSTKQVRKRYETQWMMMDDDG